MLVFDTTGASTVASGSNLLPATYPSASYNGTSIDIQFVNNDFTTFQRRWMTYTYRLLPRYIAT